MIVYSTVKRFFAAEGSGSTGTGDLQQQQSQTPVDPFASLVLDDLDPATRAVIEASKTTFATLQKENKENKERAERTEQLARQFQSKSDQLEARFKQFAGPQQVDPKAEKIAAVEKIMVERGIPAETAKAQAPIMAEMFGSFAEQLKLEIGRDLAPLGATVMQGEAQRAWQQAESQDRLAALQIPEVRTETWKSVQQLLENNQPVTAATIINLRNIHYANHQEANSQGQMSQQQQQPQQYNQPPAWGPPAFSGGGHNPNAPRQVDPRAPRHTLNADTQAAIDAVTRNWPKPGGKR